MDQLEIVCRITYKNRKQLDYVNKKKIHSVI